LAAALAARGLPVVAVVAAEPGPRRELRGLVRVVRASPAPGGWGALAWAAAALLAGWRRREALDGVVALGSARPLAARVAASLGLPALAAESLPRDPAEAASALIERLEAARDRPWRRPRLDRAAGSALRALGSAALPCGFRAPRG